MSERRQIHQAVDATLSGLREDPWLTQKVLRAAQEQRPYRRRKLRTALILALVLALMATAAVAAALLSARQIVDEQAVPMANEYEGDSYTLEDTNLLVQIAEENGIELSQNAKDGIAAHAAAGEGYWKEELIMALAKAEFGDQPARWTLEQQKWFSDVCVAIGFLDEATKGMPEEGEAAKDPILAAAEKFIRETYNPDEPLTDESKYAVSVQYINGDVDGEFPGMYWSITYDPLFVEGSEYWVYLNDDGEVLGDNRRPGVSPTASVDNVRDSFNRVYGYNEAEWSQPVLRQFRDAILNTGDTNNRAYLCMLRTEYPDAPEGAITVEQAYAIAAASLQAEDYHQQLGYLIGTAGNPVWKVRIYANDIHWSFEIDCVTGEINNSRQLDSMHTKWWMDMVLWEVSDEVDANWVDDSQSFG